MKELRRRVEELERERNELLKTLNEGERARRELVTDLDRTRADNSAKKEQIMTLTMDIVAAKKAVEEKVRVF